MAGSIIALPNLGDSDWSNFVTIVEKTNRGYIGISLSNLDGTTEPKIEDGSVIEVNGAIFQFTTAETITGWPSTGTVGDVLYITAVPAGTVATVTFTASAPTWSGTKNGWYDSNDRYIGGLQWGGSATYLDKWIYQRLNDNNDNIFIGDGIKSKPTDDHFVKTMILDIGEWNMDTTNSAKVYFSAVSISYSQVITVHAWVKNDADTNRYDINYDPGVGSAQAGSIFMESASINIRRLVGGSFDTATFDGTASTVPNRGWVYITYDENL